TALPSVSGENCGAPRPVSSEPSITWAPLMPSTGLAASTVSVNPCGEPLCVCQVPCQVPFLRDCSESGASLLEKVTVTVPARCGAPQLSRTSTDSPTGQPAGLLNEGIKLVIVGTRVRADQEGSLAVRAPESLMAGGVVDEITATRA